MVFILYLFVELGYQNRSLFINLFKKKQEASSVNFEFWY